MVAMDGRRGEASGLHLTAQSDHAPPSQALPPHPPSPATLPPPPAGGLLDYDAVQEGLFTGRVAGLGLDVQGQEPVPADDWLVHHPWWVRRLGERGSRGRQLGLLLGKSQLGWACCKTACCQTPAAKSLLPHQCFLRLLIGVPQY